MKAPLALIALVGSIPLSAAIAGTLEIREDKAAATLTIHRKGTDEPLVTQVAKADHRPYLHPITDPGGKAALTQFSPGHHKHQTGLYWGLTRVNGRDYFHHPAGGYWRRVSAEALDAKGDSVRWRTVYELLDAEGLAVLTETQTWTAQADGSAITLDLEWGARAGGTAVKISKYNYGGLFLRMPWKRGIRASALNSEGDRDAKAEGKRAKWVDVGMAIDGLDAEGRIAIFDHPDNDGFPSPWRVDGQFGVGPCRARLGDWSIASGESALFRHRLVVYSGTADAEKMAARWADWVGPR